MSRKFNAIVTISSLPALLAASWFLYGRVADGPTLCPLKLMAGLPCFGCGLTRSISSLVHFDFAAMFAYHPLGPLVVLWIAVWWVIELRSIIRARYPEPMPAWFQRVGPILVVAFLVFWGLRTVLFFSTAEGWKSVARKNLVMRVIRLDFGNTHEVFLIDRPAPPP